MLLYDDNSIILDTEEENDKEYPKFNKNLNSNIYNNNNNYNDIDEFVPINIPGKADTIHNIQINDIKEGSKTRKKNIIKKRSYRNYIDNDISIDRTYFYTRNCFDFNGDDIESDDDITRNMELVNKESNSDLKNIVDNLEENTGIVRTIPDEDDTTKMTFDFIYRPEMDQNRGYSEDFKYNFDVKKYATDNGNYVPIKCTYIHLRKKSNFLYYNKKLFRLDNTDFPINNMEMELLTEKYGININEIMDIKKYDNPYFYKNDLFLHLNLLNSAGISINEPTIVPKKKKEKFNPYYRKPIMNERNFTPKINNKLYLYNGHFNGIKTKNEDNNYNKNNNFSPFEFFI